MKKILFVGAGIFQIEGIKKAKQLNYYTIAIDGNANSEGKHFADEFHNIDITDKEAVLKLAMNKNIDGVLSIASEVSMEATSYVVSQMKLFGFDYDLIQISHDKEKYFKIFQKNSICVPKTITYKNKLSLDSLQRDRPYYIKPSKGSGSRGVQLINQIHNYNFPKYIDSYITNDEEVLIQEVIEGKELTIDGFVFNKKFHLLALSEEFNNKSKGHTFSSELIFPPQWITKKQIECIESLCNEVVRCLEIESSGPMHLELIKNENGRFYIIDFSLRGGGFDVFTKIIRKTSGVDALSLLLKSSLGESIKIPKVEKFTPVSLSFIYPEEVGIIDEIQGIDLEGSFDSYYLKFLYKKGDPIAKPESGKQRIAYYICWGDQHAPVLNNRDKLRQQIFIKINDARV